MDVEVRPSDLYKIKNITAVKPGDFVINLGIVLEIDELPASYALVISRQNQKQVFQFLKDEQLVLSETASIIS